MKKMIFILMTGFLFSCSNSKHDEIYYEYNGVTVTRINKGNQIYFYYGNCGKENPCVEPYINAKYSGFVSGMGAYLIFEPDKTIQLVNMYASFEKKGNDHSITLREYDNVEFIPWQDSIRGNFENVIYVSDIVETEKTLNLKNHSKVKAVYP